MVALTEQVEARVRRATLDRIRGLSSLSPRAALMPQRPEMRGLGRQSSP